MGFLNFILHTAKYLQGRDMSFCALLPTSSLSPSKAVRQYNWPGCQIGKVILNEILLLFQ